MGTGGKKRHLISSLIYPSILCFVVLGINSHLGDAGSETRHFYYYYSEKIYLDMSTEMVAICLKETTAEQDRRALITTDPTFEGFSEEALPSGLTLALTKAGLSKEDIGRAVERLNGRAEVKYCTPVFEYQGLKLVLMDQFVARFRPVVTREEIATLNKECGVEVVRISPYRHNRYVLRVVNPKAVTALEMANAYNEDPRVRYASPDFAVLNALCSTEPNDTYFNEQWNLANDGNTPAGGTAGADIKAPEGWDISTGTADTVIAVIDTGVDIDHNDLAANIWTNSDEQEGDGNSDGGPGIKDVDDDGDSLIDEDGEGREPGDPDYDSAFVDDDDENGYIDDIEGWDFVDEDSDGDDGPDNDPSPNTDAHGTLCAGLAAAVTNNGEGVAGVSWSSKIMALRVRHSITSQLAEAVDYAAANGADVLSNSWRISPASDLTDAIVEAKSTGRDGKGCVIVCSSGNFSVRPPVLVLQFPASLDETIAVGATDANDEQWDYSIGGAELNVVAPSGDQESTILWTTDIMGSDGWNHGGDEDDGDANGDYSKWFTGTSAATPQVAGLAALILSVKSDLTSDEVQFIIESTADDLGESGWDPNYGWGRINVEEALTMASDYPLFRVEDSDGRPVADFDAYGNLFLKGTLEEEVDPLEEDPDHDEFRVQDPEGDDVTIIDATSGNMYIKGVVHENQVTLALSEECDEFVIRNSSNAVVGYIDDSGDLYLIGSVYGPEP